MKKLFILTLLFFVLSANAYAYDPFFTYDDNILEGTVTLFRNAYQPKDIVYATFDVVNKSKTAINLNKVGYLAVGKDGSIYRFENPNIIYNQGIDNSSILNPNHAALVTCETPFRLFDETTDNIKEIYIKCKGKRIFFVPEEEISEYQKMENKTLRHLRNFWWDIK